MKMPTCPICLANVDTGPAYLRWSGRLPGIPDDQGIRCRSCNTILRVSDLWVVLFNIGTFAVIVGPTYWAYRTWPDLPALFYIIAVLALAYISYKYEPRFAILIAPDSNEELKSDDEAYDADQQISPEMSKEEYESLFGPVGGPEGAVGRPWRCSTCSADNDKEFRLCWKCGGEYVEGDN